MLAKLESLRQSATFRTGDASYLEGHTSWVRSDHDYGAMMSEKAEAPGRIRPARFQPPLPHDRLILADAPDPDAVPMDVVFDREKSRMLVADSQRWRIQIYNKLLNYSDPQFNI